MAYLNLPSNCWMPNPVSIKEAAEEERAEHRGTSSLAMRGQKEQQETIGMILIDD